MREIVIAVAVGLFFFLASGAMTAVAIKYGTPSLLWDAILWGSVAGMAMTAATLAIFISSQVGGRPFLMPALLVNLGICAITGGLVWHFSGGSQSHNVDLRELSNDAIRQKVSLLVPQIRSLSERTRIRPPEPNFVEKILAIQREFNISLRPQARSLAIEMLRRRGFYEPFPVQIYMSSGANVILGNSFAGPNPISDGADFLENLAQQLPK